MTPPKRSRPPLSSYDPVLGPVLAARRDLDVFRSALAVTCRGLDAGIPPSAIRLWLRSRGGQQRFASITATPRSYQRVLTKARARVASASSLPARRRDAVTAARRLVGFLLTPVPDHVRVSAHRQTVARHALAIVGLEVLASIREKGWDTALVSGRWLAVRMGVEERTARAALKTCVELRWLRVVSTQRGGSTRYTLPRLNRAQGATADAMTMAVDALAEGDVSLDPLAEIIALVAHPSVGHGLGAKAWLTALADQAEVDPVLLGVGKRAARGLRREWLAALVEHAGDPDLEEPLAVLLDRHAEASGALASWQAAEAKRREIAEARRVGTADHRDNKKALYRGLLPWLRETHPIPPVGDTAAYGAWLTAMTAEVAGQVPEDVRRHLAAALTEDIARAGYGAAIAEQDARQIVGLPAVPPGDATAA